MKEFKLRKRESALFYHLYSKYRNLSFNREQAERCAKKDIITHRDNVITLTIFAIVFALYIFRNLHSHYMSERCL